ncbi:MAG: hypothetical protein AAFS07_15045 [Pseudomonadota bacterium]
MKTIENTPTRLVMEAKPKTGRMIALVLGIGLVAGCLAYAAAQPDGLAHPDAGAVLGGVVGLFILIASCKLKDFRLVLDKEKGEASISVAEFHGTKHQETVVPLGTVASVGRRIRVSKGQTTTDIQYKKTSFEAPDVTNYTPLLRLSDGTEHEFSRDYADEEAAAIVETVRVWMNAAK